MKTILVFHGDDIINSRRAYSDKIRQYVNENYEIIRIEGKNIDDNFLHINLYSPALFTVRRVIAIDCLFSLPKNETKDKIITLLNDRDENEVVIWENKEVDSRKQPAIFQFIPFKLPNDLFIFLDQLNPVNITGSLLMLEKLLYQIDESYIFLMLVRQVRLLLLVKGGETGNLQSWQVAKLKHQSDSFTTLQLISFYRRLRDIDYRQKTSQTVTSYLGEVEYLLANL